uniref:Uncharacterized protein n=1 Tax=Rhizophora mucronata TaxID=61149 RepID=A0A2P2N8L5_RHIMU
MECLWSKLTLLPCHLREVMLFKEGLHSN